LEKFENGWFGNFFGNLKIFTGANNLPVFLLPPHILKRRLVLGLMAVVVARVVGVVCDAFVLQSLVVVGMRRGAIIF
jgi:hypothetical protein